MLLLVQELLHCGTGEAVAVAVGLDVDVLVAVGLDDADDDGLGDGDGLGDVLPPTVNDNRHEAEEATASIVVQLEKVESVQI